MFEQLENVEKRYEEITAQMSRPEVAVNPAMIRDLSVEQSRLEDLVRSYREYRGVSLNLSEAQEILKESDDEELKEMASLELDDLSGAGRVIGEIKSADVTERPERQQEHSN
jgi:peptide chain release factor 1